MEAVVIRVEVEESDRFGLYNYEFQMPMGVQRGKSRMPLLDACRAAQALGEAPTKEIGIFRKASSVADLKTTVGYGARLVVEKRAGGAMFVRRYP